jgi:hypothetical protein
MTLLSELEALRDSLLDAERIVLEEPVGDMGRQDYCERCKP